MVMPFEFLTVLRKISSVSMIYIAIWTAGLILAEHLDLIYHTRTVEWNMLCNPQNNQLAFKLKKADI